MNFPNLYYLLFEMPILPWKHSIVRSQRRFETVSFSQFQYQRRNSLENWVAVQMIGYNAILMRCLHPLQTYLLLPLAIYFCSFCGKEMAVTMNHHENKIFHFYHTVDKFDCCKIVNNVQIKRSTVFEFQLQFYGK